MFIFKRIFFILLATTVFTACTTLSPQQLPMQAVAQRLFKVEQIQPKQETSLLAVQFSTEQWRWVQTDPLGVPIARLLLTKQGWQNDGFVMPNHQAKLLFTALAVALNPNNPPFKLSDEWKIANRLPYFEIQTPDGAFWRVDELEQQ